MSRGSNGMAGKLALGAGAFVLAVALPSSVYAVGKLAGDEAVTIPSSFASFTPASVDPRLAAILAERSSSSARMMRFTPAGASESGESRSVTVAVRLGAQSAQAITGRGGIDSPRDSVETGSGLRINSTRFNLGLARGYSSFAQQAPALSASLSTAQIPDLAEFRPSPGARDEPSRFAARVEMEGAGGAVRSAQEPARLADQMLDVGGSYRLTRNLDVTAGVRYQQERDLRALPEVDKQDSQAVYIGTQFRF
jgi:hypothetical protein